LDVVQDNTKAQIILNKSAFPSSDAFEQIKEGLRRGNIVEANGIVTRSKTNELSLKATELSVLAPCNINLPDKEMDIENRTRYRHLDMLSSDSMIQVLKTRAHLLRHLRHFLDSRGFFEVETPILASKYGGANARPFVTEHNSSLPLYLRIAPELALKQLIVGGMEKVYEIGKVFRNEGIDSTHNPEFTSCEFYLAYANSEDMIDLLKAWLQSSLPEIFAAPFERIDIVPFLESKLGISLPLSPSLEGSRFLTQVLRSFDMRASKLTMAQQYDKLIGHFIEPFTEKPTLLMGHPICMSPLAKSRPSNPLIADRFELFYKGSELANGFAELNDPELQRRAFLQQVKDKQDGDSEAHPPDEDYVQVLEAGLPPTGGCGIGIDRLVMLATGLDHIRDVLAFPLLRPRPNKQSV
jgi:lysyl-tRNA synthetase class 2